MRIEVCDVNRALMGVCVNGTRVPAFVLILVMVVR